ncbi:MAG: SusD/RagB family nutrient-binding outer membrane lipoprotein [Bacteroidia bacterium]|nr:SusD/RagB family nutrient-binding outer membrane lipoprotein [Bacteroidia bacterium]
MNSYFTKAFAIILVTGIVSCSKDDLRQYDLKQQKDAVESLNDPYLLSSIIKQTTLFYQDRGWGSTKLPGAVQYTMRNFQGGDNYYSGFKGLDDGMYSAMNILKLVDASIKLAEARGSDVHVGIFTTFRVLLFSFMTDYYGDVYYSQALKGREGILYPVYDKQSDIYTGLLKELDNASALISSGKDVVSPTYDLMFGGDKVQWEKFCNSLKLRLLMRASAKLPDAGAKIAAVAALPIFSDDADMNASIAYVGTNSVNSWVGGSNNWGNGGEFERRRPCKSLVDRMATLNDPRMKVWFAPIENPWTYDSEKEGVTFETTDPNGFTYSSTWEFVDLTNPVMAAQESNILDVDKVYAGFIAGMNGDFKNGNGHWNTAAGGTYGNFKVSKYSKLFQENAHPLLRAQLMNKDEVQFILAEAAVKGLISGNADTYYRTGIKFSMERWGVSQEDITAYLAQSVVGLPGDAAGKLAKIAEQKWIALFSVAIEAYLDLRRTKLPDIFNNGLLSTYTFPLRFRYPGNELGQNKNAYDLGVATLVPPADVETSKIWLLQ